MLKQLFAWWDSTTYGTSFSLWRKGARLVGKDEQGNRYYEESGRTGPDGRARRFVVYHGVAEASRVTPDWHGWLHHTFEDPPTVAPLSLARGESGIPADYEAWSPESEKG
jgi:NADH:ubiquinone oxidoreductase subunit